LAVMKQLKDTRGRVITKKKIMQSMTLSLIGGGMSSVWFMLNAPQQILTIYFKNYLKVSSTELGLFLGFLNLISIMHLASIFIYSLRKTIKPFWITMGFIHRSLSFTIAASSFSVAAGGDPRVFTYLIMASSMLTFFLGNTAGSGWWAWMNDIIPANRRSSYFGKRSALAQTLNIISFFAATFALDYFSSDVFTVFGYIYAAAGVLGVMEVFLHLPVPEPAAVQAEKSPIKTSIFFKPFRDKHFRTLCIVGGVSLMGVNVAAPFFGPMITNPEQIGAPVLWLGIMFAISQVTWVVIIPFWGTMMDRFGKKPVTMVGMLFPVSYVGYIFLTPENYVFMLPIIAFFGGLFSPALYEGLNQTMLALVPRKDRTVYIAWFWAMLGSIQAFGPIIGGFILQSVNTIGLLVFSSIGIMFISFLLFDTIAVRKEIKFTRLVSTITSPGIIKAYFNIPILGKSSNREKVGRALQDLKDTRGSIALDEIVVRLEDADEDVREEAVRALGRIGGEAAVAILIENLQNEDSLVRIECARALGKLRVKEAVPFLINLLPYEDEKLVEAAARALGRIDSPESSAALLQMLHGSVSVKIKSTSLEGISERQERIQVLQDILDMRGQTTNRVIRKQLSIALGNILGEPGEFYQFLTGTEDAREAAVQRLFRDVKRQLKSRQRTEKGIIQHILDYTLPSAINHYDMGEYALAFYEIEALLLQLVYRHIAIESGQSAVADAAEARIDIELLSRRFPRLTAGYLVLQRFKDQLDSQPDAVGETELLLLFYVLKYYGVTSMSRDKKGKRTS
jgi:hypothetical protein